MDESMYSELRSLCSSGRYSAAKRLLEVNDVLKYEPTASKYSDLVELICQRSKEAEEAVHSTEGSDWTVGAVYDEVKTTYRVESDGSLSVCVEGVKDFPNHFLNDSFH